MRYFLLSATLCLSVVHATGAPRSAYITALTAFTSLAKQCHESAKETAHPRALTSFTTIATWYKNNRTHLCNLELCSDQEIEELATQCSSILHSALSPHVKLFMVDLPASPELIMAHVQTIQNTVPDLLTATPQKTTLIRTLCSTFLETAIALLQSEKLTADTKTTSKKYSSDYAQRFKKLRHLNKGFGKESLAYTASALGNGVIDEYLPRGISSQKQKLIELVTPFVFAAVFLALTNRTGALRQFTRAWQRALYCRAYLSPSHPLFKPLNLIAYAFPWIEPIVKYKGNHEFAGQMLFDGMQNSLIFSLVPLMVDKLLPHSPTTLHPEHRRKVVSKIVRDVAKAWCNAAEKA